MQRPFFTPDFLHRGVPETLPRQDFDAPAFAQSSAALQGIFAPLDAQSTLNETQTEALVIHKVVVAPSPCG